MRCAVSLFLMAVVVSLVAAPVPAQSGPRAEMVDERAAAVQQNVVDWRRDIHAHPELANQEHRTAAMVASHLRSLGMSVETGVAKTGVVGTLEGPEDGPVVALRADMDALPVKERTDVPFASTDSATYNGQRVPVAHACGHDAHVAMLMGAAEVLASMQTFLSGTVKFLFQPAEEGAPNGGRGGARAMIADGALRTPDVDAVFGLHIDSKTEVGTIRYTSGPIMAASDVFRITVKGEETHASTPWEGVDPIVAGSEIVTNMQTIVSRHSDLSANAAVVSVGRFEAGTRNNVIPQTAELVGTVRTLDQEMRRQIHRDIRRVATSTGVAMGAAVDVDIRSGYPMTKNDPSLTSTLVPAFQRASDSLTTMDPKMGAEDFAYFARHVPGAYVFVGGRSPEMTREEAPSHHSSQFFIDERGLQYGVRAFAHVALEVLSGNRSSITAGTETE